MPIARLPIYEMSGVGRATRPRCAGPAGAGIGDVPETPTAPTDVMHFDRQGTES